MKLLILCLTIMLCVSCSTPDKRSSLPEFISQHVPKNDGMYMIDGRGVGAGGSFGKFFAISEMIASSSMKEFNLRELLVDPDPCVRTMGLVCLAKRGCKIDVMDGDETLIYARPNGCIPDSMTVEDFSKMINTNTDFRIDYEIERIDVDLLQQAFDMAFEKVDDQGWSDDLDTDKTFSHVESNYVDVYTVRRLEDGSTTNVVIRVNKTCVTPWTPGKYDWAPAQKVKQ